MPILTTPTIPPIDSSSAPSVATGVAIRTQTVSETREVYRAVNVEQKDDTFSVTSATDV